MTYAINFLVVNNAPFSLIIRRPAMKTMRASLDSNEYIAIFRSVEQVATVPRSPCTEKENDGRSLSGELSFEET